MHNAQNKNIWLPSIISLASHIKFDCLELDTKLSNGNGEVLITDLVKLTATMRDIVNCSRSIHDKLSGTLMNVIIDIDKQNVKLQKENELLIKIFPKELGEAEK